MTGTSLAETRRDLAPDRLPWEKQPWESWPSFKAFALYRDLGLSRSLTKAAQLTVETMPERKRDTVRTQFSAWSGGHRWVERAEAYDLHVDARHREQREGEMGRQNRRYAAAAATVSSALLQRLGDQEPGVDGLTDVQRLAKELDLEGITRALMAAQRVERLATGQSTAEIGKSAFGVTTSDAERIFADLVQIALPFILAERQPLYAQAVQAYIATGARPGS